MVLENNTINPEEFQKSITEELKVIQNRVRNLIGNANWGEEGRYKEAILKNTIKKFVPENIGIGTGFIVNKSNGNIEISKQIDIIVYNKNYPLLFSEGDFLITTPENVKGIIEVKTNLDSSKIKETISKSASNGEIIKQNIFNGIFVFNYSEKIENNIVESIELVLKESKGIVNHICLGENYFIKLWKENEINKYSIYEIKGLSFSYFISNLIEKVCEKKLTERWWFLYPIEKRKEQYKIKDIFINNNEEENRK